MAATRVADVLAEVFRTYGFDTTTNTQLHGASGREYTVELQAEKAGLDALVHIHHDDQPVDLELVSAHDRLVRDIGASYGVFATTGTFTEAAHEQGARNHLILWDRHDLEAIIGKAVLHEVIGDPEADLPLADLLAMGGPDVPTGEAAEDPAPAETLATLDPLLFPQADETAAAPKDGTLDAWTSAPSTPSPASATPEPAMAHTPEPTPPRPTIIIDADADAIFTSKTPITPPPMAPARAPAPTGPKRTPIIDAEAHLPMPPKNPTPAPAPQPKRTPIIDAEEGIPLPPKHAPPAPPPAPKRTPIIDAESGDALGTKPRGAATTPTAAAPTPKRGVMIDAEADMPVPHTHVAQTQGGGTPQRRGTLIDAEADMPLPHTHVTPNEDGSPPQRRGTIIDAEEDFTPPSSPSSGSRASTFNAPPGLAGLIADAQVDPPAATGADAPTPAENTFIDADSGREIPASPPPTPEPAPAAPSAPAAPPAPKTPPRNTIIDAEEDDPPMAPPTMPPAPTPPAHAPIVDDVDDTEETVTPPAPKPRTPIIGWDDVRPAAPAKSKTPIIVAGERSNTPPAPRSTTPVIVAGDHTPAAAAPKPRTPTIIAGNEPPAPPAPRSPTEMTQGRGWIMTGKKAEAPKPSIATVAAMGGPSRIPRSSGPDPRVFNPPEGALLAPVVSKERAAQNVRDRIYTIDDTHLRYHPKRLFRWKVEAFVEGQVKTRTLEGVRVVDLATRKVEAPTQWTESRSLREGTFDVRVDHKPVRIEAEKARALALDSIVTETARNVKVEEYDRSLDVMITEVKRVRTHRDDVQLTDDGLHWCPVWCFRGVNGEVEVDALTGQVIAQQLGTSPGNTIVL